MDARPAPIDELLALLDWQPVPARLEWVPWGDAACDCAMLTRPSASPGPPGSVGSVTSDTLGAYLRVDG
jgi:hypothetical protein